MKNKNLPLTSTLCVVFILATSPVLAQSDAGNILKAGKENANRLMTAYIASGLDAAGQGANDGWNNTAKHLGQWGLDLRLNAGMGMIPSKDQTFDFNSLF